MGMTSRERVLASLNHLEPDRVPVDFGGTTVTGIHASALNRLRNALGLKKRTVKVYEPMQMLGVVEEDAAYALGSDVVGLYSPSTLLGYKNEQWKQWRLPDGTEVLIGGGFTTSVAEDGTIYAYPKGNRMAQPSARMPANGYYFDNIVRQQDLRNHEFDARRDYGDQYSLFSEEDCRHFEKTSEFLYSETDCALFGNFFLGGVGDIFHIPGAWLEHPKGIRDLQQWILAHFDHPEYVKEFFTMQREIQLQNLELYREAIGDRIVAIAISGTDFGAQNGPLISLDMYREFYKPYHKTFNGWVHEHTNWKTFIHTCGSVIDFIEDFIEAGFDILNPVQVSAARMDPEILKIKYGKRLSFWGGGVDPQHTLPFGTPDEVQEETKHNVAVLAKGGGYVCGTVHNIQAPTPVKNIIAFFEAVNAL
jgi:hypothetical protein